jgi:hypothetical protein
MSMARNSINGARARRYVRVAQMAGVALGVAAAALWAMEVPGLEERRAEKPQVEVRQVATRQAASAAPVLTDREEAEGLAVRLSRAAGKTIEEPTNQADAPAPPPAPAADGWRYIAPMRMGKKVGAVVFADGKQRVLSVGQKVGETTLVSVDDTKLVVRDPAGVREVHKGDRAGSAVTWGKLASNTPAPSGTGRGPANGAGAMGGLTPEQMAQRGISEAQAQRFRDAMRERQARNRAGPVAGDPSGLAANPRNGSRGMMDMAEDGAGGTPVPDYLLRELNQRLESGGGVTPDVEQLVEKLKGSGYSSQQIQQHISAFKAGVEKH